MGENGCYASSNTLTVEQLNNLVLETKDLEIEFLITDNAEIRVELQQNRTALQDNMALTQSLLERFKTRFAIYDEHQKAKTRKMRPFYTPPPRLARAALSFNGSTSSTGVGAAPNHDPLVDAHQRLLGEVFFLRSQVQDMVARRDLLIQHVRASARWKLMKEWLEKRVEHWDPEEEYSRYLFLSGGINQLPQSPLWGRDSRRSLSFE
ncbi:hypothetical protein HID58_070321 [Brassica napus]|uniref:Uncharacterized protein n=1 Tax=Brassica napus TaxID=3708 RepID=A0ABQ7YYE0_BRANA|nr:hypothetical protein HID58_070321 [Brassica napus]